MESERPLILVIDDEESMRDSCCLILSKEGLRTAAAEDGSSGIKKIKELKPDMVLIDLKMPGINGFEVLEKLQNIDPGIIAIVITGYATVESAVEAMKRGAYDFLPKPFSPEELRIIIRRGLERRRLIRETENLRREKKLMEENFITMVSHQLRSPLVAIGQYFEAIRAGIIQDKAKEKEMLAKANVRLEGLLNMINDWLDIARMNGGQIIDKLRPISLFEILKKQVDFYSPAAEEDKISLQLIPQKGECRIMGDPETLEQVFSNLISNAIKYNRPGGSVSIAVYDSHESASVTITDTGQGIADEHLPFLFDQFYRVKRSESEKRKGTGLGLSITKKIIDAHGGEIRVESEPGKGSTFTVILPKKDRSAD